MIKLMALEPPSDDVNVIWAFVWAASRGSRRVYDLPSFVDLYRTNKGEWYGASSMRIYEHVQYWSETSPYVSMRFMEKEDFKLNFIIPFKSMAGSATDKLYTKGASKW